MLINTLLECCFMKIPKYLAPVGSHYGFQQVKIIVSSFNYSVRSVKLTQLTKKSLKRVSNYVKWKIGNF